MASTEPSPRCGSRGGCHCGALALTFESAERPEALDAACLRLLVLPAPRHALGLRPARPHRLRGPRSGRAQPLPLRSRHRRVPRLPDLRRLCRRADDRGAAPPSRSPTSTRSTRPGSSPRARGRCATTASPRPPDAPAGARAGRPPRSGCLPWRTPDDRPRAARARRRDRPRHAQPAGQAQRRQQRDVDAARRDLRRARRRPGPALHHPRRQRRARVQRRRRHQRVRGEPQLDRAGPALPRAHPRQHAGDHRAAATR